MKSKSQIKLICLSFILVNLITGTLSQEEEITDDECNAITDPLEVGDCTKIKVAAGKKCCYLTISKTSINETTSNETTETSSQCLPLVMDDYLSILSKEKEIKENIINDTSITYKDVNVKVDCDLLYQNSCAPVRNPEKAIVCYGREIEDGFSCCFIEADNGKFCFPKRDDKYTIDKAIADDAQEYLGFTSFSDVDCNSKYIHLFMSIFLVLFLLI
ncbi:MAG: hypothetical protein MJ252_28285 [archaeon]|nr:hypothetical protein [archaeon]